MWASSLWKSDCLQLIWNIFIQFFYQKCHFKRAIFLNHSHICTLDISLCMARAPSPISTENMLNTKNWMNSWCEFALIVNTFCVWINNTQKGHLFETMEKWTDYGNRVTCIFSGWRKWNFIIKITRCTTTQTCDATRRLRDDQLLRKINEFESNHWWKSTKVLCCK